MIYTNDFFKILNVRINLVIFVFFTICNLNLVCYSQNISIKIIDENTKLGIEYVSILLDNEENLITNSEGIFTIIESKNKPTTTIAISHLGYGSLKFFLKDVKNNIVVIKPIIFNLETVEISSKKLDVKSIMNSVKSNLKENYTVINDVNAKKDVYFLRETNHLNPSILDFNITNSSDFSKQSLKAVNNQLSSLSTKLIKYPAKEFKDYLVANYTLNKKAEKKYISKFEVIKATKLKNTDDSFSIDDLQKTAKNIFLTHLDTTKFYRVKSGLFGSRDTISINDNYKKKKKINPKLLDARFKVNNLIYKYNLNNKKFDFIHEIEKYEYKLVESKYLNENEFVYIIEFKPKKNSAIYSGKMYVSDTDYSVLKLEYKLAEGKKGSGINLKFLLGVKSLETMSVNTIIFKKNSLGKAYIPHYISQEEGEYIYLNRPLKFIEITNSEKDILALDIKIEVNTYNKIEFLNVSHIETSESVIDNIIEKDFKFTTINKYDSNLWKNYITLEPSQEMKQLKLNN